MPDHPGRALQPVLLQCRAVKQPVIDVMRDRVVLRRRTTRSEITHGVAPAMLKQMLETHSLQFIGPDPIGVGPWSIHRFRRDALHSNAALVEFRGDAEGGGTTPQHQHINAVRQDQSS